MTRTLAVRADGGAGVGAGHVMRSLALADAWQAGGGSVEWFSAEMPPLLCDLLAARRITRHDLGSADDWDPIAAWARRHDGPWVVLDGYGFRAGPSALRAAGARVLVIDDTGTWPQYDCDVLVNQNPGAESIDYRTRATARLLGPGYALLRDEFRAVPPTPRSFAHPADRVLLSFGGHDQHGLTERMVRLLAESHPATTIEVVVGILAREAQPAFGQASIRYHARTNLVPLMQAADAAIVAAGSICWELAYLGLPALALVVAANQEALATGLDRAGVIRSLGWHDCVDDRAVSDALTTFLRDPAREAMSRRGRSLVDGDGASRVVGAMLTVERSTAKGGAIV